MRPKESSWHLGSFSPWEKDQATINTESCGLWFQLAFLFVIRAVQSCCSVATTATLFDLEFVLLCDSD